MDLPKSDDARMERGERVRRLLTIYSLRMIAAMLCWAALETAAASWELGQARTPAQRGANLR